MARKTGRTTGEVNSVSIPIGNIPAQSVWNGQINPPRIEPGNIVSVNGTPHQVNEVNSTFITYGDNDPGDTANEVMTRMRENTFSFTSTSTTGTLTSFNNLQRGNHESADNSSPMRWSTNTTTGGEWASTDNNGLTWPMAGGHNHSGGTLDGGLRMDGQVQMRYESPHPDHWGVMYERGDFDFSGLSYSDVRNESSKLTQKQLEKLTRTRNRERMRIHKKQLKEHAFAQRKIAKAKKKADQLLRKWLTENEYQALKHEDGLKVQSKLYKDVTYVVRSLSYQRVERWTRGKLTHLLCVVSRDPGYENDDTVLQKILMLQTNERQFLQTAVVSYVK